MKRFMPLIIFGVLVVFLGVGLTLNPREVPSPLIDKPAPGFDLPQLHKPEARLSSEEMKGRVWLFNVWASWCVSCRVEHPLLVELSRTGELPIYGLNYKDEPGPAMAWLRERGNPYVVSAVDADGRVGIDFGVYGVPETYLIDKQGVIRYKQIGPVTRDVIRNEILPLAKELNAT